MARPRGYRSVIFTLAAGAAASATAATTPTLEATHGTRLGKRCDYSGSVAATSIGKTVAVRSVFQDPVTCTLVLLIGPAAAVDPPATAHTTMTFAVGRVARIGTDSLAVGPLECRAGLLRPLLARFQPGQSASLSCRDGAISATAKVAATDSAYAGGRGPLTSIDDREVTVGPLTCRIAPSSPSTHTVRPGEAVDITCRGGALDRISAVHSNGP